MTGVDARPVLVGLPGTLCGPEVFAALATGLAGEVDVRAVDWMTAPGPWDLPAVADRVAGQLGGTGPVLLAGHSTGGAIALALTAAHPELVAGLLLVGTGAQSSGHGDMDAIIERVATGWGPQLRAAVLDRSFAGPLEPALRARLLAWSATVPQEAVLQALRSQRSLDLRPVLGSIGCPVTVVHGVHDRARTAGHAHELVTGVPGARLVTAQTGHTAVHEAPELVAGLVRELAAAAAAG